MQCEKNDCIECCAKINSNAKKKYTYGDGQQKGGLGQKSFNMILMSLFELDRLTDNSRKGRKVIVPKKKREN